MSKYELTVVIAGGSSATKKKSVKETIEKIVKTLKGKVADFDDWGEIDLAYEIAKSSTGNFLHFKLELDQKSARQIVEKLKLEDEVIRYLIVKESD
jgi:small subunit ribosomal protein S6